MGNKATKAEMEARIQRVYEMLLSAESRPAIIQYAAEKWQISPRQTDTLIKRATEEIGKRADTIKNRELGRSLARLNLLYNKASRLQDYTLALNIIKETNKLLALYEPQVKHVDLTSSGESLQVTLKWPEEKDKER